MAATKEMEKAGERRAVMPATDIMEDSENFYIAADIPGADEKSVEVTVEDDVISFYGKRNAGQEAGGDFYAECATADYKGSFSLSNAVEAEKISARLKDGVLTLTLPKAEKSKTKKININ